MQAAVSLSPRATTGKEGVRGPGPAEEKKGLALWMYEVVLGWREAKGMPNFAAAMRH